MIYSISGRINSGKDTVGKIIQILKENPNDTNKAVLTFLKRSYVSRFRIVKWADTLKDIVCLILGCTRSDLENRSFKEKELPEQWWYYKVAHEELGVNTPIIFQTKKEAEENANLLLHSSVTLIKPTPRLFLQQMGTECGREILHPSLWVQILMSKYSPSEFFIAKNREAGVEISQEFLNKYAPNWIITDTRFPNELKAVKDRGGITIQVIRKVHKVEENSYYVPNPILDKEHFSETALDNETFDYVIYNDGTLEDLIDKVRNILYKKNYAPTK